MSIDVPRGQPDQTINQIIDALKDYEADHPAARIDIYRQNSVSVRIRIIDPDLAGKNRADRNDYAWTYLARLTDETQADISFILMLTPDEVKKSFANMEFEDPIPSQL